MVKTPITLFFCYVLSTDRLTKEIIERGWFGQYYIFAKYLENHPQFFEEMEFQDSSGSIIFSFFLYKGGTLPINFVFFLTMPKK